MELVWEQFVVDARDPVALGQWWAAAFHARYGDELAALVDDFPSSARATADLFLGASRSWLRPPMPSPQRRMQASAATTCVASCSGFLVAPAINRSLLDPPTSGTSGSVRTLLNVACVTRGPGAAP